jgi:hypothetical protein
MENNPNMIDSLFTPRRCVLTSTPIGELVRDNKNLFLHRGCWHKFKGYAYSQLKRLPPKYEENDQGDMVLVLPKGKRRDLVLKYGYDTKFAYHVVRLILECRQILAEHTLDLERHKEQLKAIRAGEWTLDHLNEWFTIQEKQLEVLYAESTLPYKPDEKKIKQLLVDCLEHHYGNLSNAVILPDRYKDALQQVQSIVSQALNTI